MHEVSITQSLLEIALEQAKTHQAKRIKAIRIKAGEFSGVNQATLKFAFKNLSKGTIAENASLQIISPSLLGQCQKCKDIFKIKKDRFKFAKCNSSEIDIISGQDLYIQDMDIE
jgi:hydrogenase nickel incorporation protein HypA/HybF